MITNIKDDQWIVQLRKGTFELAILSLLSTKAMYGYELTSSLKQTPIFQISEGAIYPILKRMTDKEWIEFFWADSGEGPRRKYYQITSKGEKILSERIEKYKEMYEALIILGGGKS